MSQTSQFFLSGVVGTLLCKVENTRPTNHKPIDNFLGCGHGNTILKINFPFHKSQLTALSLRVNSRHCFYANSLR